MGNKHSASCLVIVGMLAGCYGTKPPPPLKSLNGPPGLVAPIPVKRPVALPSDLLELLVVYRQALIQQSHHLPLATANNFADAEIITLRRRYEGRDDELKSEIAKRLQPPQSPPLPQSPQNPRPGQNGAGQYPIDPADDTRRAAQ